MILSCLESLTKNEYEIIFLKAFLLKYVNKIFRNKSKNDILEKTLFNVNIFIHFSLLLEK